MQLVPLFLALALLFPSPTLAVKIDCASTNLGQSYNENSPQKVFTNAWGTALSIFNRTAKRICCAAGTNATVAGNNIQYCVGSAEYASFDNVKQLHGKNVYCKSDSGSDCVALTIDVTVW